MCVQLDIPVQYIRELLDLDQTCGSNVTYLYYIYIRELLDPDQTCGSNWTYLYYT